MYENHYDGDVCPNFNGGNQNIINKYPNDNSNKPPKQGKKIIYEQIIHFLLLMFMDNIS